jgi:hypothetical protein
MTEAIVYIDRSAIRPEKVEEVKRGSARLVEFIRAHEPQLIFYAFYIDEVASSMTVVAVHPDSTSLELHLRIGGPEFRKLAHLIDLRSIEVFGEPSEAVMSQLHEKAQMLGENGRVIVHRSHAGFARVPSTPPLGMPER